MRRVDADERPALRLECAGAVGWREAPMRRACGRCRRPRLEAVRPRDASHDGHDVRSCFRCGRRHCDWNDDAMPVGRAGRPEETDANQSYT